MATRIIQNSTLKDIADAIRARGINDNGITPIEMASYVSRIRSANLNPITSSSSTIDYNNDVGYRLIDDITLKAIADALRETGVTNSNSITPLQMPNLISNIQSTQDISLIIDYSATTEESRYSYADAAVNMTQQEIIDWFGIYNCVLYFNGTEAEILNPNNLKKKTNGSNSTATGNVMTVFPIRGLKYTWLDANRIKITFTKETNKSGFNYDAFYGMDGVKRDKFYLGTYYCSNLSTPESKRSKNIDFSFSSGYGSFFFGSYGLIGSNGVNSYYATKRYSSGNNSTANNFKRYSLELGRNLWYRIMALAMCYKTLDVSKSGSIFYNKANKNKTYTTGYSDTYGLNGVSSRTNGGLKALGVEDFWSYQSQLIDGIYFISPSENGNNNYGELDILTKNDIYNANTYSEQFSENYFENSLTSIFNSSINYYGDEVLTYSQKPKFIFNYDYPIFPQSDLSNSNAVFSNNTARIWLGNLSNKDSYFATSYGGEHSLTYYTQESDTYSPEYFSYSSHPFTLMFIKMESNDYRYAGRIQYV